MISTWLLQLLRVRVSGSVFVTVGQPHIKVDSITVEDVDDDQFDCSINASACMP